MEQLDFNFEILLMIFDLNVLPINVDYHLISNLKFVHQSFLKNSIGMDLVDRYSKRVKNSN